MRWPRARQRAEQARVDIDPVVVSVTSPLNRQTALDIGRRLERLEPAAPVVIDLTAIPAFDTDGAAELLHLQGLHPDRHVSIVGLRRATARLVGVGIDLAPTPRQTGWVQRRLRNLVVVQPADERLASLEGLEPALTAATATDAAIVVVDLKGIDDLDRDSVDVIAFASSAAALRGQEMLVVNVSASTSEALRVAGLSSTTYVAPEPLGF